MRGQSQAEAAQVRLAITVSGIVQGVGLRPFVFGLAENLGLTGSVCNESGRVQIEVQGCQNDIDIFLRRLRDETPPLAEITALESSRLTPVQESAFHIKESAVGVHGHKFVPADAATCADCLRELFDPNDRRYLYPFINCTNCGPRFTIIKSLPYDRPLTTMAPFTMCRDCRNEYEDPSDRRFHAQPVACPECGPVLRYCGTSGEPQLNSRALAAAIVQLERGEIVAVKGLGGFHLICDAMNEEAVQKLKDRKGRCRKPLALMLKDLDSVREHCLLSAEEASALTDASRPIVLLSRRRACTIPGAVAPGADRLGVMLPYTPLHHLLLHMHPGPLVATSANLAEEPIAIDNDEARRRLSFIADGYLDHNRDIYCRYDDSIMQLAAGKMMVLRRSRGLAPRAIKLPFEAARPVLAVGAHLKNTFCLIKGNQAFLSQHIGDMENLETEEHFRHSLSTHLKLFDIIPEIVACDLHPDYMSTSQAETFAARNNLPLLRVQHHHAHIVSCMVEHGLDTTIGVAFDGLGLGDDGGLWGAEFFLSGLEGSERLAHFEPAPLPGGSLAIKQPWRMALGCIEAMAPENRPLFAPFIAKLRTAYGAEAVAAVCGQIAAGINTPLISSCGRLFDAMAALLDICQVADYEGEAASALEAIARGQVDEEATAEKIETPLPSYPYSLSDGTPARIATDAILAGAYRDYIQGKSRQSVAAAFHQTLAAIISEVCANIRHATSVNTVCLSGGVFQNRLLLTLAKDLLERDGFQIYFPQKLPANDGGLSLGQAVAALAASGNIIPTQ